MTSQATEPPTPDPFQKTAAQREQEERLAIEAEQALANRPQFSIRLRIYLSMLLCILLVTVVVLVAIAMITRVSDSQQFLEKASTYALEVEDARRHEKNFLLYGTNVEEAITRVEAAQLFLSSNRESLAARNGAAELARIEENLDRYGASLELLARMSRGQMDPGNRAEVEQELRRAGAQAVAEATEIVEQERQQMHGVIRTSWYVALSSLFFIFVVFAVVAYVLVRQVAQPLHRFVDYSARIAAGDYSPIRPRRHYRDEFSRLAIAINRMIFRLKDREAQLARTSRMVAVGTLTAGIAHELNNPLNNISLNTEALLDGLEEYSSEQIRRMLQDTANQVDRASGTVRNLLDFTRVEKPVSVPLLLCDIVQGAQRLVANEAAINDVEFDIQLPEDLPRIEGNPRDVQQIFLNLYINAIQAMPDGGTLTVRGKAGAAGDVEVQVSDTGVGIAPEDLPSIFDPFFTSKEPGEGTGLGLFVTYGIVQRHHGTIEVSSVVGEGTTFTVSFAAAGASRKPKEEG